MAREIADQLMENGSVTRGFLGVIIQPLTKELAESFGLSESKGVLIGDVSEDGPAAKAGLKRGDVVIKLDGKQVEDVASFRNHVSLTKPGTKVRLEVMRDGKARTLSVEIGTLADEQIASSRGVNPRAGNVDELGLSVQSIDTALSEKLGVAPGSGVVITNVKPGSPADVQGLEPGMIVKEVDHQAVTTAEQFTKLVKQQEKSDSLLLLVQQGDFTRFVVLKLSK
jgi:serine protease Do